MEPSLLLSYSLWPLLTRVCCVIRNGAPQEAHRSQQEEREEGHEQGQYQGGASGGPQGGARAQRGIIGHHLREGVEGKAAQECEVLRRVAAAAQVVPGQLFCPEGNRNVATQRGFQKHVPTCVHLR